MSIGCIFIIHTTYLETGANISTLSFFSHFSLKLNFQGIIYQNVLRNVVKSETVFFRQGWRQDGDFIEKKREKKKSLKKNQKHKELKKKYSIISEPLKCPF